MKKKLLSIAVAAAVAGPVAAVADGTTVFGEFDLSVNVIDLPSGGAALVEDALGVSISETTMESNDSTLGIKGSESLGNGWNAIYEFGFDFAPDESSGLSGDRDQFLGVKSEQFGALTFGTNTTAYKAYGEKVDPFNRHAFDSVNILLQSGIHAESAGDEGEGLASNTIKYVSPSYQGFGLMGHYTISQDTGDDGFGAGIHYDNGMVFVSGAYQTSDADGEDEAWQFNAALNYNQFSLFGQFELDEGLISDVDGISTLSGVDDEGGDTWFVGGSGKLGSSKLVVQYGQREAPDSGVIGDIDTVMVGAEHWLSPRTSVYAGYANIDPDGVSSVDVFSFGVHHRI